MKLRVLLLGALVSVLCFVSMVEAGEEEQMEQVKAASLDLTVEKYRELMNDEAEAERKAAENLGISVEEYRASMKAEADRAKRAAAAEKRLQEANDPVFQSKKRAAQQLAENMEKLARASDMRAVKAGDLHTPAAIRAYQDQEYSNAEKLFRTKQALEKIEQEILSDNASPEEIQELNQKASDTYSQFPDELSTWPERIESAYQTAMSKAMKKKFLNSLPKVPRLQKTSGDNTMALSFSPPCEKISGNFPATENIGFVFDYLKGKCGEVLYDKGYFKYNEKTGEFQENYRISNRPISGQERTLYSRNENVTLGDSGLRGKLMIEKGVAEIQGSVDDQQPDNGDWGFDSDGEPFGNSGVENNGSSVDWGSSEDPASEENPEEVQPQQDQSATPQSATPQAPQEEQKQVQIGFGSPCDTFGTNFPQASQLISVFDYLNGRCKTQLKNKQFLDEQGNEKYNLLFHDGRKMKTLSRREHGETTLEGLEIVGRVRFMLKAIN